MSSSRVLRQEEAANNNNGSCQERAAVNVNHQDHEGNSALSLACRRRQKEVVLRLLKEGTGVDIGLRNLEGITPYIEAISNGHPAIAFELLIRDPFMALGWLSTAPIRETATTRCDGGRRRRCPQQHNETTSRKKQRLVVPDVEEQQSKRRKKQKRN